MVASGSVLTAVVEREKLQADPEFGEAPPGLLSSIFGVLAGRPRPQSDAYFADPDGTRRPATFVIDISVSSKDPAKAARIANAIATVYSTGKARNQDRRGQAHHGRARVSRLAELRERVSQSAHRVEDYKAQHKIIGASGQLVNEQQLSELNNQLMLARARTAEQTRPLRGYPAPATQPIPSPIRRLEAIQSPADHRATHPIRRSQAGRGQRASPLFSGRAIRPRDGRRRPGRAKPAADRRGGGAHRDSAQ